MTTTLVPAPPPHLTTPPRRPSRAPFRPDIEGLRAVAVLSVLAFHAHIPGLNGGFVGVDVFFVISGYLITGQLYAESRGDERISLRAFYARRARRILPPAAVVLAATTVATYLLLPPLAVSRFTRDIVASLGYVANWHFIGQGKDYLAASNSDSVVLHFWSLAVEEQFYLIWPLLVVAAVWFAREMAVNRRRAVLTVLVLATAGSFAASFLLTRSDPGLAYMATYTRAWQFGVGGIVAVLLSGSRSTPVQFKLWFGTVLGILGAGGLVWSLVAIDEQTPYPGLAALAPTFATAALIAAGPPNPVSRLVANPVFRTIGRWSFSWYLWHWPVLVIAEARYGPLTWHQRLALTLGSGVLAALSYWWVEVPSKRLAFVPRELRTSAITGIATTLLAAVTLGGIAFAVQRNLDAPAGAFVPASVSLTPEVYRSVFDSTARAGGVTPSTAEARTDLPRNQTCLVERSSVQPVCRFGVTGGTPVVLFGDSHADQWQPAFAPIAKANGWELTEIAQAGCPAPNLQPVAGSAEQYSQTFCTRWRTEQIDKIVAMRPRTIILSSYNHYIPDTEAFTADWIDTIDRLRASGARIVYLVDTPLPHFNVPECVSAALDDWSKCAFEPVDPKDPVVAAIRAGRIKDVTVVDMNPVLCPAKTCPAVRGGVLLYRDETHLTATAVNVLGYPLRKALTKAGVR
ncbi:MAG: Acyltransferase 3 [Marmoricola sp.]|nr:Acyltransferase 3 [Marmoricola sp.]